MEAIIRYPNAQRIEVLVLSVGRFTMRVVPRRSADTIELKLDYGQWTDEAGVPIEFESFLVCDGNHLGTTFATASQAAAVILEEPGNGWI